jgi:hypothetical protein
VQTDLHREELVMSSSPSFESKPSLYLAISKDGGVLLDITHDRLLKLNSVGVEMWTGLSRGTPEASLVTDIAKRYAVEPHQVQADLRHLVASAAELGLSPDRALLTEQEEQSTNQQSAIPVFRWYGGDDDEKRPTTTTWSVIRAFLLLAIFDFIVAFRSFESMCHYVHSWKLRSGIVGDRVSVIGGICTAVEKACIWYPKKALCLQRSAVTTCMLRSRGIPADMVIGVRSMPFHAHAWVETGGAVINDFRQVKKFYQMVTAY